MDRRAARVVLVDRDGRVLLIQGTDRTAPERGSWWLAPGGGIEAGESPAEAAVREVQEETGFVVAVADLGQPIWERISEFTFEGESFRQHEVWFLAHVDADAALASSMTEQELRSTIGTRWWSVDDLRTTNEVVLPADLGSRLLEVM